MKIAFVILHYKVESITKKCIDYLLEQDYNNFEIVVIDNCSKNGSYEKLVEEYVHNDSIYFVSAEYNLGFAKANDLGYQIAKHKFGAECIVVVNNDLFIKDTLFCSRLSTYSEKNPFFIMGPDIINKIGEHQNPLVGCADNKKKVQQMILRTRIKIMLFPWLYVVKKKVVKEKCLVQEKSKEYQQNVPLHGSCLIFGKKFIDEFEFPFYPDTFLYGEEDILYYRAQKKKIMTMYNPDFLVYHVEDVATESISKSSKKKRLFELKNSLNSLRILKKMMKEDE